MGPAGRGGGVSEGPASVQLVDARGLSCPLPIIRAKRALGTLAVGDVLEVWATDQGSVADFTAWCRATGHDLLEHRVDGDVYRFWLRRTS